MRIKSTANYDNVKFVVPNNQIYLCYYAYILALVTGFFNSPTRGV